MVLVTGATGFIGAALVARFAGLGQEVLACDARPPAEATAKVWGKNVKFSVCDVRDRAAVKAVVERAGTPDPIVHLAGILTAGCDLDPGTAMQVNLLGFQHVLDAALSVGKNRVVLSSTIGVYGRDLPQPIDETMRTEPDGWYG
jgi:nucleoside-diphosphate-sugar epimerase